MDGNNRVEMSVREAEERLVRFRATRTDSR